MSYIPTTAGDLRLQELPRRVLLLAEALAKIHGEVRVSRETSGLHLYMASPKALEEDGLVELEKLHLAVNVDKHFEKDAKTVREGRVTKGCARCMKYEVTYSVRQLLSMPPIAQRGYPDRGPGAVKVFSVERMLVPDGKGNMIPPPPGEVIPITQLPVDHPGPGYLLSRGYDLQRLELQFRCGFCVKEWLNNEGKAPYRRLPDGFRDTPQNRIIFFGDIYGVQQIWQARIPEFVQEDGKEKIKFYLHPYRNEWVACERQNRVTGKWEPLEHLLTGDLKWDISKYKTAMHAAKSQCVLGLDAAIAWNKNNATKKPTGVLMEGPLDAGRIGPPAMPMIGKTLSDAQAQLLIRNFRKIIFVSDNDVAGAKSRASVSHALGRNLELVFMDLPAGVKDMGALNDTEGAEFIGPTLYQGLF